VDRKFGFVATAGVIAVALILVLAACGGDGGGESNGVASLGGQNGNTGTTTTGSQDPQQAALEYTQCMRENGVDMADPGSDGELQLNVGPGNRDKVEKAQRKCEPLLENARPRLTEEQQNLMQEAQLEFAKCMREHGIDMPDPVFGEGGRVTQRLTPGSGVNPDDPKFKEAQEACEPIVEEARRKAGLPEPGRPNTQRSGGGS
jgi:hypothetical protein